MNSFDGEQLDSRLRSVYLNIVVEEDPISRAAVYYANTLCSQEGAHLTVDIATIALDIPSGRLVAEIGGLLEQVNSERRRIATSEMNQIEVGARLAGITADCRVVNAALAQMRENFLNIARTKDVIVLPKPVGTLATSQSIFESLLFESGRPIIIIPPEWDSGCSFEHVVVAWDASREAARAVGDAIPFLKRAKTIDIACVSTESKETAAGADLAAHLNRHCRGSLRLSELPASSDIGETLQAFVRTVGPDLTVMGAFGHSRWREYFLGGVTVNFLETSTVPLFISH